MTESIVHRGPDEDGFYVGSGIELGMRRLSIIDVSEGHQPAFDETGNIAVVFNGEIYNFVELRAELRALGHVFRSHSDTEVIAHLYEEIGTDCFERLRGMFAVALWDATNATLVLARDRVGKKPLLFRQHADGSLDFASEARALFRPLGIGPNADLVSLNRVLAFGHADAPWSAYEGIRRLEPGSILEWRDGAVSQWRYWEPAYTGDSSLTLHEAVDAASAVIENAVRARLVSERPLGAFLSGGIDSTIVTAFMARHHSGPVSTFTIGFTETPYDESPHASAVARFLGTDHHELIVRPDPEALLGSLRYAFDEPFADSSALPTLLVSEFARRHVVVALTGDGGDEVFSGYERYRAIPTLQRGNLALGLLAPAQGVTERLATRAGQRRLARLSREFVAAGSLAERYCAAMSLVPARVRRALWAPDALAAVGPLTAPEDDYLSLWSDVEMRLNDSVRTMSEMDMRRYLPGDLLVKVDIASMAHSLEARSPLLDQNVIEFAQRLPTDLRIKGRQTKVVLREVARRLVPAEIVDRPKMGFGIPRADWLRGPLRSMTHALLTDETAKSRNWFDQASIARMLAEHDSGLNRDHILWPVLAIEMWAREWLD